MEKDIRVVKLGEGKLVVTYGFYEAQRAIVFETVPESGVVGSEVYHSDLSRDSVSDGATIIILGSKEAAQVLIEQIQDAFDEEKNPSPPLSE